MIAKVILFEKRIEEYEMMLDESTIWLVRLQGVGYANAEEMVAAGVSGPNVRAAGVNYDVRWHTHIRCMMKSIGNQQSRNPLQ